MFLVKGGAAVKKVAVIMGSDSDLPVVSEACKQLQDFGIPAQTYIISAHRTPERAARFAREAAQNGFGVIIAAAGKAAHLAGVVAAYTTLPVIGVPIGSPGLWGMDSLLSTVQMPPGVPVATVSVDGARNAAILAAQILAVNDDELTERLVRHKADLERGVTEKDAKLRGESIVV
jgi:5-(carboxyamino)imidazole ribonucleotide mutase